MKKGREEQKSKRKKKKEKTIEKTIVVSLYPGRRKRKILMKAQRENTSMANEMIKYRKKKKTYTAFHKKVYKLFRSWGFHSQVQKTTQRRVYANKKTKNKEFRVVPLEFNFPRSGKIAKSKRGNPILFVSPYKKRIALPIILDGAWKRLKKHLDKDWKEKSCIIYNRRGKWEAHIVLSIKKKEEYVPLGTVGVDVGEEVLAAVTLNNPNYPLVEFYRGKDLSFKREQLKKRRAVLQQHLSQGTVPSARRAKKRIKKLYEKEKNFVRTRCAQIAREIISLAYSTQSALVVEDLRYLRKKFSKHNLKGFKGVRSLRRRLNRWIYRVFYSFLERLSTLFGVPFVSVCPHYTSQTCSRCGRVSKSSRVSRSLYVCSHCSININADRNASRNISFKGLSKLCLILSTSWFCYYTLLPSRVRGQLRPSSFHGGELSALPSAVMIDNPRRFS